jgi:hypothetical protein
MSVIFCFFIKKSSRVGKQVFDVIFFFFEVVVSERKFFDEGLMATTGRTNNELSGLLSSVFAENRLGKIFKGKSRLGLKNVNFLRVI